MVLSNKSLVSYNLSALDANEPGLGRRPKKIQSHCNFFKAGICLGRHLVCAVKSSALSTTIKVYEPNDAITKTKKQKGLGKMFGGGQDELRPFKEFYIPAESSSVHFLKSKLCVACAKGFEVVSLETLETQSLLDQADTSLDFVARKEGVRPIHIERLNGEFLLNYSEFSFFVNKHGWRARPEWRIDWEGSPQNFALSYPWILGFESNFIELRDIESGAVHIVPHKNIRMLHSSTNEVSFALLFLFTGLGGRIWEMAMMLTKFCRFCSRTRMIGAGTSSSPSTFGRAIRERLRGRHRLRTRRAAGSEARRFVSGPSSTALERSLAEVTRFRLGSEHVVCPVCPVLRGAQVCGMSIGERKGLAGRVEEGMCGVVWFLIMVAGSCLVSGSPSSFNIIQYVLHSSFLSLVPGILVPEDLDIIHSVI